MSRINNLETVGVNSWYTKLTDIVDELDKRSTNNELEEKIDKLFGDNRPEFFNKDRKYAVFTRSIFTPNHEMAYFLDLCNLLKLEPLLLEYSDGKFVARNLEKYRLARLKFYEGIGKHHGIKNSQLNILNFNEEEGKKMEEITTLWGEKVIEFHHHALFRVYPYLEKSINDFSAWFNKTRTMNSHYYFFFLSLFLKNCVLFENFIDSDNEETKFTEKHFLPSFIEVKNFFGLKPLIYPLLPIEYEKSDWWYSYNEYAKKVIFDRIKTNK